MGAWIETPCRRGHTPAERFEMNTKSLLAAIERMIEKLPTWQEDAIIYEWLENDDLAPDTIGVFDCDPRSTYEMTSRDHSTIVVFECHDLNDIFPDFGNCEDDAAWLLAQIINQQLGTDISTAAAIMGRKGGQSKSEAKQRASRENGKLGGRPSRNDSLEKLSSD